MSAPARRPCAAALVLVLTACGSLGTGTGSPRSTGDLFSALPGTVSAIPAPPSASQDDKARSAVPTDPGPEWKRVTAEDFDSFRVGRLRDLRQRRSVRQRPAPLVGDQRVRRRC